MGDHIRTADGGYSVVEGISILHSAQPMYNLTVDTAHTFFVGDVGALVHNQNACPIGFTEEQWDEFQGAVTKFADEADLPDGELLVHGSRVPGASKTPRPDDHPEGPSDIDVMLRVDDETFDRVSGEVVQKTRNRGGKTVEVDRQIAEGRMTGFVYSNTYPTNAHYWNLFAPVRPASPYKVQFSIIRESSTFNTGPFITIGGTP